MWLDENGVTHTVALPEPTDVMSDDFRKTLDALVAVDREAVQSVVERAEMSEHQADWSGLRGSDAHVGVAPPRDLLQGRVQVPDDVARAIEQVIPRWRLDVIFALDDYLG